MTMTIALIALAHAIPIFVAGALTTNRVVFVLVALAMVFVAIKFGGNQYLLFDLVAVGLASFIFYPKAKPHQIATSNRQAVQVPSPVSDPHKTGSTAAIVGGVALVALVAFLYNKSTDKPALPAPSLSARLEALAAGVSKESFNQSFPLLQAQVQGNSLNLSFRSTDQTAAGVIALHKKTNFSGEYSAYYCASQVYRPLLAEGAQIVVTLSGKDAKPVGTYLISKAECNFPQVASSQRPAPQVTAQKSASPIASQADKQWAAAKTNAEWNRGLPTMLDSGTMLTKVEAGTNLTTYFITMVKYPSAELDQEFLVNAQELIGRRNCGNSDVRWAYDQGVHMKYIVSGSDNRQVGSFIISKVYCERFR